MLIAAFSQQAQIDFSVRVVIQKELPRISALRHMVRNVNGYHPGKSCHAAQLAEERPFTGNATSSRCDFRRCAASTLPMAGSPSAPSKKLVGAERFELPTLCSQSRCATRLRYAPTFLFDCIAKIGSGWQRRLVTAQHLRRRAQHLPSTERPMAWFDGTIERECGGYSSVAERLSVAQDVEGSIPSSRPNLHPPGT